jgi:putative DNA-invertase from lambdoid prophage Rac
VISAYIRVSTDRQDRDNQRFEILKFIDERKWTIDRWCEETVSSRKSLRDRELGELLDGLREDDVLVVTEISRLGRSLMEVMTILHSCMERGVRVYSIKEAFELGDNINSKVLAFAFGLSAEIERRMISQRTKEALARKKSEGVKLGRPRGSLSSNTKLSGKDDQIVELLSKSVSITSIAKIMGVSRGTVYSYIDSRGLRAEATSAN